MFATDIAQPLDATLRAALRQVPDAGRPLVRWVVTALLTVRRRLTTVRVRAHLRRTEHALRAAETDHLDTERRRRREAALDALRAYRRRGAVPTNEGDPARAPQFVDANGVPCAVAALALADGERGLVEPGNATTVGVRSDCEIHVVYQRSGPDAAATTLDDYECPAREG